MAFSEAQKKARVAAGNILYAAGMPGPRVMRLVGMPRVSSIGMTGVASGIRAFGGRPDDDLRVRISYSARRPDAIATDPQRNVSNVPNPWTYVFRPSHNVPASVGDTVNLDVFDGWSGQFYSINVEADVAYVDGSVITVSAGSDNVGNSDSDLPYNGDNNLQMFRHYYEGGFFVIPPPLGWPWPKWLRPVAATGKATLKRIT